MTKKVVRVRDPGSGAVLIIECDENSTVDDIKKLAADHWKLNEKDYVVKRVRKKSNGGGK